MSLPEGRHSHSAVAWQQSVIIAGGLSATGEAMSSCLQLSLSGGSWSVAEVVFDRALPARLVMAAMQHVSLVYRVQCDYELV